MLNSLKIKTKLLLLAGVPALALLGITAFGALQMFDHLRDVRHAQSLGTFVVAVGEVVHELQKERGMSAGFLSSKGSKFADRLPKQREASDAKIDVLKTTTAALDIAQVAPGYRDLLAGLDGKLGILSDFRKRISALGVVPPLSFRTYSDLIADLLTIASRTSNELPDAEVARLANAKSALLYLKERNGQERAILSGAFSADSITPANFDVLLTLISDQSNYLRITKDFATDEQTQLLVSKLNQPIVADVDKVEQMVKAKGPDVPLGYKAETWFDQITQKIDLLRDVEQQFSDDIGRANAVSAATAMGTLTLYLAAVGMTLLATILLGTWIVRGILRQMGGEPAFAAQVAHNIARGDLDNVIPLRKGDQGSLLASMENMQRQLRERIVTLEEKKQEAMALADEWKQQGRDLSAFGPLKEKAEAAREQGDFETVEKILDEVIRRLKTE